MLRVEASAQVIVQPPAESEVDALVHIRLDTTIVTRTAQYAGDRLRHVEREGGEIGVEILFPVAIHPVILSGRVDKADRGNEIMIIAEGQILQLPAGRDDVVFGPYGRTLVISESGIQLEAIEQLDGVSQFRVIVMEIVQVEVIKIDRGLVLLQDLLNLVRDLGGIGLVVVAERQAQLASSFRQIFPKGVQVDKDLFPFEDKTDVRIETELAVAWESLADAEFLLISDAIPVRVTQLEGVEQARVFDSGGVQVPVPRAGQSLGHLVGAFQELVGEGVDGGDGGRIDRLDLRERYLLGRQGKVPFFSPIGGIPQQVLVVALDLEIIGQVERTPFLGAHDFLEFYVIVFEGHVILADDGVAQQFVSQEDVRAFRQEEVISLIPEVEHDVELRERVTPVHVDLADKPALVEHVECPADQLGTPLLGVEIDDVCLVPVDHLCSGQLKTIVPERVLGRRHEDRLVVGGLGIDVDIEEGERLQLFLLVRDRIGVDRFHGVDEVVGGVVSGVRHQFEKLVVMFPVEREEMIGETDQEILLQDLGASLQVDLGAIFLDDILINICLLDYLSHDRFRRLLLDRRDALAGFLVGVNPQEGKRQDKEIYDQFVRHFLWHFATNLVNKYGFSIENNDFVYFGVNKIQIVFGVI